MRVASLFAPPKTYSRFNAEVPEGQAVVFAGRGASEKQAKRLLAASVDPNARRQWQYVLFGTHGLADTFNGMLSCLALASPAPDSEEDGFLQAQEVMERVILSTPLPLPEGRCTELRSSSNCTAAAAAVGDDDQTRLPGFLAAAVGEAPWSL